MLKAREICNKETHGGRVPYVMVLSYILDKGVSRIKCITDEEIDELEENGLMTKDFIQILVRTARKVCMQCDQSDIVRLFKAEWCCGGEVYDPDLDQFVTDVNGDEYYE